MYLEQPYFPFGGWNGPMEKIKDPYMKMKLVFHVIPTQSHLIRYKIQIQYNKNLFTGEYF
jgi:hypothetical protein